MSPPPFRARILVTGAGNPEVRDRARALGHAVVNDDADVALACLGEEDEASVLAHVDRIVRAGEHPVVVVATNVEPALVHRAAALGAHAIVETDWPGVLEPAVRRAERRKLQAASPAAR